MTIYQTAEYQQACLLNKSLSSQTDNQICKTALEPDPSSKYETPRWEDYAYFREYVDEAKRRGYSAHSCAALFGWESAQTKQVQVKVGDVENRLTKLKGLYDKGLITQGSYDDKRRVILEAL